MNFANLSLVADERHHGVKLLVLLKIFNKQEFVSMFEYYKVIINKSQTCYEKEKTTLC